MGRYLKKNCHLVTSFNNSSFKILLFLTHAILNDDFYLIANTTSGILLTMGLTDIMAQPDPLPSRDSVAVVSVHHVPSHSRESSTSSTASAASTCSNHGLSQTAEEELTSSASSSPMPIYSPLSICSSPTANSKIPNHSVIIQSIILLTKEKLS